MIMKGDIKQRYLEFNKMVEFYENLKDVGEMHIIGHPSEVDETNVVFIHPEFTIGIYTTPLMTTIKSMGYHLFDDVVFINEDIESIEYDMDFIKVNFKKRLGKQNIYIDLVDIKNSIFREAV